MRVSYCSVTPVVFNLGAATPRGVVNHFWRVPSRYFMYTAVLHMLYSSFGWGLLESGLL